MFLKQADYDKLSIKLKNAHFVAIHHTSMGGLSGYDTQNLSVDHSGQHA
jgi:hypothetical protein